MDEFRLTNDLRAAFDNQSPFEIELRNGRLLTLELHSKPLEKCGVKSNCQILTD